MFKLKQRKDTETLIVVVDALLALLFRHNVISRQELQQEISDQEDADIQEVGGIKYKL